jgi:aspartate 1-decarboxylase
MTSLFNLEIKRTLLRAKIHRATVTRARLDYEGSISIDTELMRLGDFVPFERVDIYNCQNGNRFSTYVIPGEKGEIGLNGAAARLVYPGDLVIIASYVEVPESLVKSNYQPKLVFVNERNEMVPLKNRPEPHLETF